MASFKILIPVENSTWSEGFIAYLNQMCIDRDCEMILLHVIPDLTEINQDEKDSMLHEAEQLLENCASKLKMQRNKVRICVEMGNVKQLIPQRAIAEHADLIAMTTHARTGMNRIIEGSIAESVMRVAHCPTFLCHTDVFPRDISETSNARILVPLEANKSASELLAWLKQQIPVKNRELILYHAYTGDSEFDASRADSDREHAFMDKCKIALEDAGYKVSAITTSFDSPAKDIVKKVDELEIDLIIMATHGRSGVSRLVFGSVAESVLHNSDCPLLTLSMSPTHEVAYQERYIG